MMDMMRDVSPGFRREANHVHCLSPPNRLFMFLIWLRSYPSVHFLSLLFDISSSTVSRELNAIRTIMWDIYADTIVWPTPQEWLDMRGNWSDLPDAVGAIDGTSHRI
ncbi:hypothetical protein CI610_02977 [invertebrate metagenome]|uniref:Transposase Helix-turn-helix domain-containing protein n=1 Tax=invertebrate metagenome TaxID=1711999 RepID=A0A2H9T4F6_9ZZZZ